MSPRGTFFLFLALAACDDHDIVAVPAPAERPTLQAGTYALTIVDVKEGRCAGMRPEEMVGESVTAELAVRRDAAILSFGGWVLRGEMAPGSLYVEGSPEMVEEYDEDVDTATDAPDEGDADGEVGSEGDEEEGRASSDSEGEDTRGEDEPDREDDEPSDPYAAFASLDAQIVDAGTANGRLLIEVPDCSVELAVELVRGEADSPPVVEEIDEDDDADGDAEPVSEEDGEGR